MAGDDISSDQGHVPHNEHHNIDKYGTKFVDKTEKYAQKIGHSNSDGKDEKKPAGGYDDTSFAKAPPGYTLRITFHRADNLPFADMPSFSSDPYIWSVLKTDLPKRHKQDPDLQLRTQTVHRNTNPTWNTVWTIAHVPASGFHMKCRIYDEDPADHDDRLGNVHVDVDHIDENWKGFKERAFDVKKRMGSKRAYTIRGCAALLSRRVKLDAKVIISVENLGRSEGNGGRAFTVSPLPWSQHFSPLIGMIAGVKNKRESKDGKSSTERYNFQAIQMQLQGPVPEHLYHRYVEFRPFVAGMFTSHSLRGRILNHALHHQHARIYNYDGSTKYGEFEEPNVEMSQKFLDFVNYDRGGRIFTYVITLDGQFRFTETGKEFGVDLLSKHTMHSDVSIYIAFSGEFFVRRLKHANKDKGVSHNAEGVASPSTTEKPEGKDKDKQKETRDTPASPGEHSGSAQPTSPRGRPHRLWARRTSISSSVHSPAPHADQTNADEEASQEVSHYELIIDNDSGTYRPNAKYLGQLKKYLQHNFPGLRIATLDCQKDEEKMQKLKSDQRERKKKSGQQITYMQNLSSSSLSSSDEEDLERRAGAARGPETTEGEKSQVPDEIDDLNQDEEGTTDTFPQDAGVGSTSKRNSPPNRVSISTTGEKASFDTATEHGDGHFVTPKPSLGDGGLGQFTKVESRTFEKGIDEELEKRGMGRLSQDTERPLMPDGQTNGHLAASSGSGSKPDPSATSVHHSVTSGT